LNPHQQLDKVLEKVLSKTGARNENVNIG
jgi:hypothetical protein